MPTYTLYSGTADADLYSSDANPVLARAGSSVTDLSGYTATYMSFGQDYSGGITYVYEAFISFDTSSVVGSVQSVTLDLYVHNDQSTTDFTMQARAYNWGSTVGYGNFRSATALGTLPLRASLSTSGLSTTSYSSFTSDSSFASNLSSPVQLVLCSSRQVSGTDASGREYVGFRSGDMTPQATYAPRLTIVTSSGTAPARRRPSGLYVR